MKRASLLLLAGVLGAAIPLQASAVPIISATVTPLGGGLFAFEFVVDANDGLLGSLFLDGDSPNSGFALTGGIQQWQAAGGADIDDEGAIATAGPGYDPVLDSYFLEPWASNLAGIGIQGGAPGSSVFRMVAGTGPASMLEVVPFAYIVSNTGLNYQGTIHRQGQSFSVNGFVPTPEPGSISLLGAGLAWLAALRRSERRRGLNSSY